MSIKSSIAHCTLLESLSPVWLFTFPLLTVCKPSLLFPSIARPQIWHLQLYDHWNASSLVFLSGSLRLSNARQFSPWLISPSLQRIQSSCMARRAEHTPHSVEYKQVLTEADTLGSPLHQGLHPHAVLATPYSYIDFHLNPNRPALPFYYGLERHKDSYPSYMPILEAHRIPPSSYSICTEPWNASAGYFWHLARALKMSSPEVPCFALQILV